jgi:serine protease Do
MSPQSRNEHPLNTSRKSHWKAAVAGAALALAIGGYGLSYGTAEQNTAHAASTAAAAIPHELNQGAPFSFADLVEKVTPAVVSVVVEHDASPRVASDDGQDTGPFGDLFRQFGQGNGEMRRFFGPDMDQGQRQGRGQRQQRPQQMFKSEARGAGYIISSDGYMVTNNHVVDGGNKVTVHLPDGREFQAKVIGTDKDTDVALLKVDGVRNLPTVSFGDDKHVRVGDWVVAVGNPFGLGGTVTAGIVSSIHRDIGNGPYTDYIQIDAPINQGNSGGPTFDLTGHVVGMNTAIYSPSGGSVGIGFAIPASTIQSVVEQIKDHGSVSRGWLGVQIQSMTPDMAASLGISDTKGAIVASVVGNSPASKAGMHQGDVIVGLNGKGIEDSRELTRQVAMLAAGSKADFTVMRDGHKETIAVTIAKRDEQVSSNDRGSRNRGGDVKPSGESALGMQLAPMTPDTRDQYGIDDSMKGVVVTSVDPDSDAATKGLQPGDVIVSIGGKAMNSPADVRNSVADAKKSGRNSVLMLVGGQQGEHFVPVKIA